MQSARSQRGEPLNLASAHALAHYFPVANDAVQEDEKRQEEHRVQRLGQEQNGHERDARHDDKTRSEDHDDAVRDVEDGSLSERVVEGGLIPQDFAYRVGGRERQDRGREECRTEEPEPEKK